MEFKEFYQKYRRMCKSYENCEGCPRNGKGCLEFDMDLDAIGELENDVEKWSRENPIKTRKQDFLDKYPYALLDSENVPKACCLELGYCKSCDYVAGTGCNKCWDEPVGDDK